MEEKRKFVRFKAPLYVKYRRFESSRDYSAMAEEVSMGGMRIVLDKSLPTSLNDSLLFYLLLPGNPLTSEGKLVWINNYPDRKVAGVQFTTLFDVYKEAIYAYVFKYYPKEITGKWWSGLTPNSHKVTL